MHGDNRPKPSSPPRAKAASERRGPMSENPGRREARAVRPESVGSRARPTTKERKKPPDVWRASIECQRPIERHEHSSMSGANRYCLLGPDWGPAAFKSGRAIG